MSDDLTSAILAEQVKILCERAYEQGIEDARKRLSYPETLTKNDLCEIMQLEMPTITKLVARQDFPKSSIARARYPRDKVFDWINDHVEYTGSLRQAL